MYMYIAYGMCVSACVQIASFPRKGKKALAIPNTLTFVLMISGFAHPPNLSVILYFILQFMFGIWFGESLAKALAKDGLLLGGLNCGIVSRWLEPKVWVEELRMKVSKEQP